MRERVSDLNLSLDIPCCNLGSYTDSPGPEAFRHVSLEHAQNLTSLTADIPLYVEYALSLLQDTSDVKPSLPILLLDRWLHHLSMPNSALLRRFRV